MFKFDKEGSNKLVKGVSTIAFTGITSMMPMYVNAEENSNYAYATSTYATAVVLAIGTVVVYAFVTRKNYKDKTPSVKLEDNEVEKIDGAKKYFKIVNR